MLSLSLCQVSSAQLEALRLENRHLRRSALSLSSSTNRSLNDTVDIGEAEIHLKELQLAYDSSLDTLEVSM